MKIVYIHPKNLAYYEDHEIFSLFNGYTSYILVDSEKTAKKFTHYNYQIVAIYKKIFSQQLYYIRGLKQILKKINPDIVVTKEIFSLESLQVHRISKKLKFKHIIIAYENTPFNNSLWGLFPVTRLISLINRNSIFIAVSGDVIKLLIDIGVKRGNIIKSYTGLFPKKCPEYEKDQNEFKILYIGNLLENKGIKTLINAFKMIENAGYNNLNLYIAGRGELAEYVKLASKGLNNIHYLGYITDEKKNQLLMDSNLFVYPSEDMYFLKIIPRWREQTATSVMEAMRCGLPVIASDSGSLPEIIGRNDMVFHQRNVGELKNKILMLYNDKKLMENISSFNKNRFTKKFDISKNANRINEYIDVLDPIRFRQHEHGERRI